MCDPVCRGPCGVHCFFGVGVGVAGGRTAAVRVPVVCALVVVCAVVVCVVVSQLTSINPNPATKVFKVQICIGTIIERLGRERKAPSRKQCCYRGGAFRGQTIGTSRITMT